jgi:D-alanyl-D-alanine carboxypeptidase/D-alanyl-D-alanine-endopeptidase (penicillin-binding protein 4)
MPPLQTEELLNAWWAYHFVDLESGETVMAENEDKTCLPGSNMKLFTFYAARKVFGDSLCAGCLYQKTDSLIFIPSGDPGFLYKNLSHGRMLSRLVNSGKEIVFVAWPETDGEVFGSGWAWDDDGKSFQPGRTPLGIYGGKLALSKRPDKPPVVPGTLLDDSFQYQPGSRKATEIKLSKKPFENTIALNRKINKNDSFDLVFSFYPDHDLLLDLLADTLGKNTQTTHFLPYEGDQECFYRPADILYKEMLFESDNFIAEQLMFMIGREATGTFSVSNGIRFALNNLLSEFSVKNLQWVDGSGLSRYNLASPSTMTSLIKQMHLEMGMTILKEYLPEGGKEGTISNYYWGDPGYVWAKTGSLQNNYALSGVIQCASGKHLAFSIMVNNHTVHKNEVIKAVESLLKYIRDEF